MRGEAVQILLVEDDPNHAELIIRSLIDNLVANQIHHVSDGEAALDYLFRREEYADAEKSPRPHLVLLDLRLPRIDGLEVLREVKADHDLRRFRAPQRLPATRLPPRRSRHQRRLRQQRRYRSADHRTHPRHGLAGKSSDVIAFTIDSVIADLGKIEAPKKVYCG